MLLLCIFGHLKGLVVDMWATHKRMAEIWHKQKKTPLTEEEETELRHCLEANCNLVWKLAKLENLSLMASMIDDYDWQLDLCRQIEEITDKFVY
jgi:hypothetical protein